MRAGAIWPGKPLDKSTLWRVLTGADAAALDLAIVVVTDDLR
jgi:hypothetical protein